MNDAQKADFYRRAVMDLQIQQQFAHSVGLPEVAHILNGCMNQIGWLHARFMEGVVAAIPTQQGNPDED